MLNIFFVTFSCLFSCLYLKKYVSALRYFAICCTELKMDYNVLFEISFHAMFCLYKSDQSYAICKNHIKAPVYKMIAIDYCVCIDKHLFVLSEENCIGENDGVNVYANDFAPVMLLPYHRLFNKLATLLKAEDLVNVCISVLQIYLVKYVRLLKLNVYTHG